LGTTKIDIRALTLPELSEWAENRGLPVYRAKQIYEWLWIKSAVDFDAMTNLPAALREEMENEFTINTIRVDRMQRSTDGTIKNAVKLHDDRVVESVLIPTDTRITACVSSQVGCSLDCNFCATARLKRMRNLQADEIYDQVVTIHRQAEHYFNRPLTNIVFMGMGEPLLNYAEVLRAIDRITAGDGLNMASRRITLSTVGIPKMIRKMADDGVKFNLAVSLHSAIDEIRSTIMPINRVNPLNDLMDALQHWYTQTRRRITFEYVVWKGINDNESSINALVKYAKQIPSKVNLIQYNSIDDPRFQQADAEWVERYREALNDAGIIAVVRQSRGSDIDAACGQLANKEGEEGVSNLENSNSK